MTCEQGFRSWLRWVLEKREGTWSPPAYVRLWNGVLQIVHYRSLMSGVSTPGHGPSHRYWLRLEAPLSGGICWWCGQRCYPGPLLGYSNRPRRFWNRVRRALWHIGTRP